jgi:hypothetical protein
VVERRASGHIGGSQILARLPPGDFGCAVGPPQLAGGARRLGTFTLRQVCVFGRRIGGACAEAMAEALWLKFCLLSWTR